MSCGLSYARGDLAEGVAESAEREDEAPALPVRRGIGEASGVVLGKREEGARERDAAGEVRLALVVNEFEDENAAALDDPTLAPQLDELGGLATGSAADAERPLGPLLDAREGIRRHNGPDEARGAARHFHAAAEGRALADEALGRLSVLGVVARDLPCRRARGPRRRGRRGRTRAGRRARDRLDVRNGTRGEKPRDDGEEHRREKDAEDDGRKNPATRLSFGLHGKSPSGATGKDFLQVASAAQF